MPISTIESIEQLDLLIGKYSQKGCATNNYIMADGYREYIEQKRLTYCEGERNLVFFLQKDGFLQLYYYLNDMEEPMSFSIEDPITMEILYRGERFMPSDVITYWEENGFVRHLGRDMMANNAKKVIMPENLNDKVSVKFAKDESEVDYVYAMIKNTFDALTGNILSKEEVLDFAKRDEIFLAIIDGQPCGFLQMEMKNNVSWLGHIAVDSSFRKQGIANSLVAVWINKTLEADNARYQLWVIQDNTPAINLYNKFGFVYANKSTVSMLKKR